MLHGTPGLMGVLIMVLHLGREQGVCRRERRGGGVGGEVWGGARVER